MPVFGSSKRVYVHNSCIVNTLSHRHTVAACLRQKQTTGNENTHTHTHTGRQKMGRDDVLFQQMMQKTYSVHV